jgi:hypothetical protein
MSSRENSMRVNQPLRPPRLSVAREPGATTPAWPSFTGTAELVGTSGSGVTVYVDPSLGAPALQNAQDLLAAADSVVQQNNEIFGITGGAVDVIVCAITRSASSLAAKAFVGPWRSRVNAGGSVRRARCVELDAIDERVLVDRTRVCGALA